MHALLLMLALAPAAESSGTGTGFSGAVLAERVVADVQARLRAQGSTATVALVGRVADMPGMGPNPRVEIGQVAGRWPRARASVPVQVNGEDGARRTLAVWLEASEPRSVLAYQSDYPANTPVAQVRSAPAIVDMVCCDGTPVAALDAQQSQRLRRAVRAGEPVLQGDLAGVPDVLAQQPVQLAVERGAVRIVVSGTALNDGVVGERISVRPQGSRVAVQARVVAPAEAMIDE
jgi:flagella basal body P-ring formation protein FlgA